MRVRSGRVTLASHEEEEARRLMKLARVDPVGEIRFMAYASGWVMVRRPGCIPWTEGRAEWLARPLRDESK